MSDKENCFHHSIERKSQTKIRISHTCPYCGMGHTSRTFVYRKLPYNEIDDYYIFQKNITCKYCGRVFQIEGYTDEYKNWLSNES